MVHLRDAQKFFCIYIIPKTEILTQLLDLLALITHELSVSLAKGDPGGV